MVKLFQCDGHPTLKILEWFGLQRCERGRDRSPEVRTMNLCLSYRAHLPGNIRFLIDNNWFRRSRNESRLFSRSTHGRKCALCSSGGHFVA